MRCLFLLIMLLPLTVQAAGLPTVCHKELLSWIRAKQPLSIVDIQSAEDFRAHSYENSIAAGAAPGRLNSIAKQIRGTKGTVIVVSATGGIEAEQATERLVRGGVRRSRIVVLEGGMEAAAQKSVCDCCKPAPASKSPD